jgi:class 3 adenylate cyclase
MARGQAEGTVAFLFSDIEGSTRWWENEAGAMREALAAHDEVLRSAIETGGGWVFWPTCGPGFAGPPTTPTSSPPPPPRPPCSPGYRREPRRPGGRRRSSTPPPPPMSRNSPFYTAAALEASVAGPLDAMIGYAHTAVTLEADARDDGFPVGLRSAFEATGHFFAGRVEPSAHILADRVADLPPGLGRTVCASLLVYFLAMAGRTEQARLIAEDTLAAARADGNPVCVGFALHGYGTAFVYSNPRLALRAYRQNLEHSQAHGLEFLEIVCLGWAAWPEALHGDPGDALECFDSALDMIHRSGSHPYLGEALARLAVCFDHLGRPETAATLHRASTRFPATPASGLPRFSTTCAACSADPSSTQTSPPGSPRLRSRDRVRPPTDPPRSPRRTTDLTQPRDRAELDNPAVGSGHR